VKPILVSVLLLSLLAGCSGQKSIGGYAIGDRRCTEAENQDQEACDRFTNFAQTALEQWLPGHDPVVAVEVYRDAITYAFGGFGEVSIVAFRMADNTLQAFHIQCGVGLDKERCFLRPASTLK
jgi:hypothetical protein